jgi:hypothetical protein
MRWALGLACALVVAVGPTSAAASVQEFSGSGDGGFGIDTSEGGNFQINVKSTVPVQFIDILQYYYYLDIICADGSCQNVSYYYLQDYEFFPPPNTEATDFTADFEIPGIQGSPPNYIDSSLTIYPEGAQVSLFFDSDVPNPWTATFAMLPEPFEWTLLFSGVAMMGALLRRRRFAGGVAS